MNASLHFRSPSVLPSSISLEDTHDWPRGSDIIQQNARPENVHLLLEGWAYRYKLLPDGRRQIVGFLLPGDLCDVQIFTLQHMDHSIGVLQHAKVALIPPSRMLNATDRHPRIARALWWSTLVDEAILREWIVNIGQREPVERIAHLLCELWMRMTNVGLVQDGRFNLPLTQAVLGDTVAVTPVTVNRVLQRLRRAALIVLRDSTLEIPEPAKLIAMSGFDSTYLHQRARARACPMRIELGHPTSMKICLQPTEVLSLDGGEPARLVLVDDRLAAILVHLEAAFYESDQGSWNLEMGFGACETRPIAPFPALTDALAWIASRVGAPPDSIAEVLSPRARERTGPLD